MTAYDTAVAPPVDQDAPRAPRRHRRGVWADTRFLLGIVLVACSVAGVWAVVALARQTSPVYAAAHTLVPGQQVTAADLTIVDAALGRTAEVYLSPGALIPDTVAARTVEAGELVPAGALAAAAAATTTTVVVHSSVDVPAAVRAGTVVELWEAALKERGVYQTPRILVPHAVVVSVTRDESAIGGGQTALEVVIPRAEVAATLTAVAGGSALSVVPAGGRG